MEDKAIEEGIPLVGRVQPDSGTRIVIDCTHAANIVAHRITEGWFRMFRAK